MFRLLILSLFAIATISCQTIDPAKATSNLAVQFETTNITRIMAFGVGPASFVSSNKLNNIAFIEASFYPDASADDSICADATERKNLPYSAIQAKILSFDLDVAQSCDGWLVVSLRATNGQILLDTQNYLEAGAMKDQDEYHVALNLVVTEVGARLGLAPKVKEAVPYGPQPAPHLVSSLGANN